LSHSIEKSDNAQIKNLYKNVSSRPIGLKKKF